jgi:hypothetical protein
LWVVARAVARRRALRAARSLATEAAVVTPETPVPAQRSSLPELIEALAREPTRLRAMAVRDALRASLGARDDETYADLIARHVLEDRNLRAAYGAVERATFCEDARVAEAAREALPFLLR